MTKTFSTTTRLTKKVNEYEMIVINKMCAKLLLINMEVIFYVMITLSNVLFCVSDEDGAEGEVLSAAEIKRITVARNNAKILIGNFQKF